jgi:hypothetical protein
LLQFTTVTFAIFSVPEISEPESQNKSVPFDPITDNGFVESAVAVERFTTNQTSASTSRSAGATELRVRVVAHNDSMALATLDNQARACTKRGAVGD